MRRVIKPQYLGEKVMMKKVSLFASLFFLVLSSLSPKLFAADLKTADTCVLVVSLTGEGYRRYWSSSLGCDGSKMPLVRISHNGIEEMSGQLAKLKKMGFKTVSSHSMNYGADVRDQGGSEHVFVLSK